MTDKVHSITIVLEENVRVDDVEGLLQVLLSLKGVMTATGNVANIESYVAETRAKVNLYRQMVELIKL